jgi:hypothetical protein
MKLRILIVVLTIQFGIGSIWLNAASSRRPLTSELTSPSDPTVNQAAARPRALSANRTVIATTAEPPAAQSAEGSVSINFEGFDDSTAITTQYAGAVFTNTEAITAGVSLNEFEFPPRSGSNVGFDRGGPVTIAFPGRATAFAGHFTYRTRLTLTGFDAANNPVASATSAFENNLALSGDAGSTPNESLGLDFVAGLSKVVITGATAGTSFAMDDLSFTPVDPSSTPLVQFGQVGYTFSEDATSAQLTITRTGNTSGTSTVFYRTTDNPAAVRCDDTTTLPGAAFSRCDYSTSLDTVTFNPGEEQKTIAVPLIDDAHVEPNETFQVVLSNPSEGTSLGSSSTTTVTVTDNDTAGMPNPIFGNAFFVRLHYLDFLSREPETTGFNAWLRVLDGCPNVNNLDPNAPSAQCDRLHVSASFSRSLEFQLKGFCVFRFYRVAFDRLPQYSEIVADMRSVTGETAAEVFAKKAAFANAFVQRQEFTDAYGALTNANYVSALLGRYGLTQITTPDPQQPDGTNKVTLTQAQLTSSLDANTLTRAQVLRALVDSDEIDAREFNRAFIGMQYYAYLRRTPEATGYNAWLNYFNANPTDFRTVVNGFVNSQEYKLRFGRVQ